MVDVELLFRIFISNKLYPALQLVLFNKGVQPDELFPLKLSWQSVGGCSCVGVVVGEQNLHATSLLAQQYDCAWFTAGDRNDGHPY